MRPGESDHYDAGYGDGESSVSFDWHFAFTDGPLGLCDGLDISPMRVSGALATILTDEQKRAFEIALTDTGEQS